MKPVVLITGASTGFGRLAAEMLARRNYVVFATMRDTLNRNAANRMELESLAASEKVDLHVLELDVTSEASVKTAIRRTHELSDRLDVVINNAGFANIGVTEAYTSEQFQILFDTNFFGVVRVNRAVLPGMRRQRSGLLIHVSSGAGRVTVPYMGAYCASKFALESLADTYRFELNPFGIDSVVVEPGMFRTPIFEKTYAPADGERIAEYGNNAEYAGRVNETFRNGISSPKASDGSEVAEAFVRLIEMPAAERPFRTVVGVRTKELLEDYNEKALRLREAVARNFNVPELLGPL